MCGALPTPPKTSWWGGFVTDSEQLERKLAAILYADVAGYSRLTGEDEEGTHRRLSENLDLISAAIQQYHGRVVHYAGDAVLADFGTVTDALTCAAAAQRDLKTKNSDLPDERKVQFRIGVNLGEVIVDRDDIYGDGVNTAARLESLAEPGGICISESVQTAVGNKLSLSYEFMGEQQVKNIEKPIRAYRVCVDSSAQSISHAEPLPSLEVVEGTQATTGELRQITVLCATLADFHNVSRCLDLEETHNMLKQYFQIVDEIVYSYGGTVEKHGDDQVMAIFGYPKAYEDVGQRAVQAGLDIIEAIAAMDAEIAKPGADLAAAVGINTGVVVTDKLGGDDVREELTLVGDAPNVAARLVELAEPGSVAIGESTKRLIEGVFGCEELGPQRLRGIVEPVMAYRARRLAVVPSRFEARVVRGLTPLVGRDDEIRLLLNRWNEAKDGEGQVVLLGCEPGIGKSRLTQTILDHIAVDDQIRLHYQCSPYHTGSALHPVVNQLSRAAHIDPQDSPGTKLEKLEEWLASSGGNVKAMIPLIAPLLSVPTTDRYAPLSLAPEQHKEQTLDALVAHLKDLSNQQPVLMVFEDVHWADPISLEFLGSVINGVQDTRVLVLITHRCEFKPPWSVLDYVTTLSITRLSRKLTAVMADKVAGKPLPTEVRDQIVSMTDGVPLFVEELTKTVLESGMVVEKSDHYVCSGSLLHVSVPATIKDSLMARLDLHPQAKEVAQIAATIGREFSFELLSALSLVSDDMLHEALSKLMQTGVVFRHGAVSKGRYKFKHALVKDTAYESLLLSRRQQLHAVIARTLEERFPDFAEKDPDLLAYHFSEAGLIERATPYQERAATRDQRWLAQVGGA